MKHDDDAGPLFYTLSIVWIFIFFSATSPFIDHKTIVIDLIAMQ